MEQQPALGALMELPNHIADDFEAFWAAYPKRPNNPKAAARTAFARALRVARPGEIMAGLRRYEFAAEPRMRPMATTWLHQCRWECESEDLTADAWGLGAWLQSLEAGATAPDIGAQLSKLTVPGISAISAASYRRESLDEVLAATGWPVAWRGDLSPLGGWLGDGFLPDSIAAVVAEAVAQFGQRRTLAAFDKRVRFRAHRIDLRQAAE